MDEGKLHLLMYCILLMLQHIVSFMIAEEEIQHATDKFILILLDDDEDVCHFLQLWYNAITLHQNRQFSLALMVLSDELRWRVKPWSNIWFNDSLLIEYDNHRWIKCFQMSKQAVYSICNRLQPLIEKQRTCFRNPVQIEVRIFCALYKLAHGCNFFTCTKLFGIGRATVGIVLRELVWSINSIFKGLIWWLEGEGSARDYGWILQLLWNAFSSWDYWLHSYKHQEISLLSKELLLL